MLWKYKNVEVWVLRITQTRKTYKHYSVKSLLIAAERPSVSYSEHPGGQCLSRTIVLHELKRQKDLFWLATGLNPEELGF